MGKGDDDHSTNLEKSFRMDSDDEAWMPKSPKALDKAVTSFSVFTIWIHKNDTKAVQLLLQKFL